MDRLNEKYFIRPISQPKLDTEKGRNAFWKEVENRMVEATMMPWDDVDVGTAQFEAERTDTPVQLKYVAINENVAFVYVTRTKK